MKTLLIILSVLSLYILPAQSSLADEYEKKMDSVIAYLQEDKWQNVYDIVVPLESKIKDDPEFEIESQILNYIYVVSLSALMNEEKFTKEEVLEKAQERLNTTMILPPVTYLKNCGTNCISLSKDKPDSFVSILNNLEGTKIYAMNFIEIEDGIHKKEEEFIGTNVSVRARLDEVTVQGDMLPRLHLIFKEGEYR